jgi:glucokinase
MANLENADLAANPEKLAADRKYWVGCDLGGTKIFTIVYDEAFKIIGKNRKRTKGHEGQEAGIERICSTISGALADADLDSSSLAGIGIGCPGPLDLDRGVIHEAPNLGWRNVPIKAALEKEFGCPVHVVNDVDAGVFGEYEFGAGKKKRCVVGVFPGTGVGGGCVYEGKLLRGAKSSCMEVGHIKIASESDPDGAGNVGTVESLASRLSIAGAAAQAAFRGQAPNLKKDAGMDISAIRSGAIADAIEKGDTVVADIVKRSAEHIGTAVITLVHLLAPDLVIIGGGLAEAMPDLYVGTVRKYAKKHCLPAYRDSFDVVIAELGDDAAVVGAAAWARKCVNQTQSER